MSGEFMSDYSLRRFLAAQYGRSGSQYSSPNIFLDTEPDNLPSTNDSSTEEEEFDSLVLFGMLRGNVVGLRYYTGVVHNNEMVALQREPNNPYDRNAVKVNNVNGEQVGHIKKELAAALAHIMDRKLAKLEGTVPYGARNPFTVPVNLLFWGREENKQVVMDHMKKYGFNLGPLPQTSSTLNELQEKFVNQLKLVSCSGLDEKCPICLDTLNMPVKTRCAHVFCKKCICEVIYIEQPSAKCPMCRGELRLEHLQEWPKLESWRRKRE